MFLWLYLKINENTSSQAIRPISWTVYFFNSVIEGENLVSILPSTQYFHATQIEVF